MIDIISKNWQLLSHALFAHLNESEIDDIAIFARFHKLGQRAVIYRPNVEIDRIYLLLQGRVKIASQTKREEEVVLEILKEGDVFGALTMKISANSHCEFAEVLSRTALVCSFRLDDFEKIIRQKPRLSITLSKMVGEKLKIVSAKYCDLVFKDVRERVLNFFMLHAQHEGKRAGNKVEINMYCTHQDIANFTASSRQTVTTVINMLIKEERLIYVGRSKVIIPDISKLCCA